MIDYGGSSCGFDQIGAVNWLAACLLIGQRHGPSPSHRLTEGWNPMPAAFNAMLISLTIGATDAQYVSPNFVVHAPTVGIARQVADAAEKARRKLAVQWYGHEISNWGEPCEVSVVVGENLGAGGATRFKFDRGEVYGWKMEVQGSLERILDSVIPHEVNHTILACYFRRKVPRWADEGAATVVEHISEKNRSFELAAKLVNQGRRIPLRVLLDMTQYPRESDQILAMYAQGYSLTEFLIQRKGRKHFLNFLNDAHHRGWDRAIQTFYGSPGIEKLEQKWSSWVLAGSPRLDLPRGQMLAATGNPRTAESASVIRSQGPDSESTPAVARSTDDSGNGRRPSASSGPAALLSRVGQFTRNLTAPDPRSRVTASTPSVFEVAAGSSGTESSPVPPPRDVSRELAGKFQPASTESSSSVQPLQPLALTRIDDRKAAANSSSVGAAQLPGTIQSRATGAAGNSGAPVRLRETRLRTQEVPKKTSDRFLNWSQFPTRVR